MCVWSEGCLGEVTKLCYPGGGSSLRLGRVVFVVTSKDHREHIVTQLRRNKSGPKMSYNGWKMNCEGSKHPESPGKVGNEGKSDEKNWSRKVANYSLYQ